MRPAGTFEGIPRLLLILAASALYDFDLGVAQMEPPPPTQEQGAAVDVSPSDSGFARMLVPALPAKPVPGKGRLTMLFSGDRHWCTYPDDRLIKPLPEPREGKHQQQKKNEVFTFGYQFTIAAIKRGAPDKPLMLFESPFFQTASLRPAYKLGVGRPSPKVLVGPSVGMHPRVRPGTIEDPDSLVPYWEERNRCVTIPERFDFDLDPGTYDVYVAFDVMSQGSTWVHRTADYLTDVPVEEDRQTHLKATATMSGPSGRDLSLLGASLQPSGQETGAEGP